MTSRFIPFEAKSLRRELFGEEFAERARALRRTLASLSLVERDGFWDHLLGIEAPAEDGPHLPAGCVPYLPCPVDAVLQMIDLAEVGPEDVFVDLGSGVGRVMALVHFLTGARAVGVEIQPELVQRSLDLARGWGTSRLATVEGDAPELVPSLARGTVFFLYAPFSGQRIERTLAGLERLSASRPIRVCCVHMPELSAPWLTLVSRLDDALHVYRSRSL